VSNRQTEQESLWVLSFPLSEGLRLIPNPRNAVLYTSLIGILTLQIHFEEIESNTKAPHTQHNKNDFRIKKVKKLMKHALSPIISRDDGNLVKVVSKSMFLL
jgi:hypothetical protein